jgi:dolichyldiphosphatase
MAVQTRAIALESRKPQQQKHQQQQQQQPRRPLVIARASSSSGNESGDDANATPQPPPKPLVLINRATKYAVSLAVLLSVLSTGASPRACWDVAGAVASSGACKLLKRALNHARPEGAPKADPGMPSSHANSLAFLAVTAALEMLRVGGGGAGGAVPAASAVLALGAFLSWLRVRLGFHTPAQVAVGVAFGAGCAVGWHALAPLALAWMVEAAGSAERADTGIKVVAAAAGVAFAAGNARGWLPAGWLESAAGEAERSRRIGGDA